VALVFLPMWANWRTEGDYVPHAAYVERMLAQDETLWPELPNFAWHLSVALPYGLLGGSLQGWIVAANLAWVALLALALWWPLRLAWQPTRWPAELGLIALTLALLLLAPLTIFTPDNAYFGYLHPYVYHNPTMLPLRPLAWLTLLGALALAQPSAGGWRRAARWAALAGLMLAGIWAKPSFALAFLPALLAFGLLRLALRQPLDWGGALLGLILPAAALLVWQSATYSGGALGWRPLEVFDLWAYHYNPLANEQLALKALLSLAFPLALLLADFQAVRRAPLMQLAWLTLLVAAGQTYLLNDLAYPVDGNLVWNGQIAVFALLMASALHAAQGWRAWRGWQRGVVGLAFGLHLLGGLLWYALHFSARYDWLINQAW